MESTRESMLNGEHVNSLPRATQEHQEWSMENGEWALFTCDGRWRERGGGGNRDNARGREMTVPAPIAKWGVITNVCPFSAPYDAVRLGRGPRHVAVAAQLRPLHPYIKTSLPPLTGQRRPFPPPSAPYDAVRLGRGPRHVAAQLRPLHPRLRVGGEPAHFLVARLRRGLFQGDD